jgi:hypothetical protein
MKIPASPVAIILQLLAVMTLSGLQGATPRPAAPVEPISAVLEAFRTHQIVALGEPHGNEQAYAFRLALLRDPRFANNVNDIVVETGNARYQEVMDRFVRGEDVTDDALRHVWQDTVGSPGTTADLPIYEDFFRAVSAVNAALPRERQIRVLLGDPPVDWASVRSVSDLMKFAEARDTHAADLIRREVLAKHRRGLVIYGEGHLWRKNPRSNYEIDDLPGPLVSILNRTAGPTLFTISTASVDKDVKELQADAESWPVPSLVMLRGTVLGATDFAVYSPTSARYLMRNGTRIDIPRDQWRVLRMEDQFDALLYFGPRSALTRSSLSPKLCADAAYLEMRMSRMALVGQPTDPLKRYCAAVAPK